MCTTPIFQGKNNGDLLKHAIKQKRHLEECQFIIQQLDDCINIHNGTKE